MQKFRTHCISIFIIIFMLIFALGTSYGVSTSLTIRNDSSTDIIVEVMLGGGVRRLYGEDGNHIDGIFAEHSINRNESVYITTLNTMNSWPEPRDFIDSIIIYNENREIIKEFHFEDYEGISRLISNMRRRGTRHTRTFILTITDALLE